MRFKTLQGSWVPASTFALALALSWVGDSGVRARLRAHADMTGDKKPLCVKVFVLTGTDGTANNGGSNLSPLGAAEKAKIKGVLDVAAEIWCKCKIQLKFDPETDITAVPASPEMVGADGNLVTPSHIVDGYFFLNHYDKISPKCMNLLFFRNGGSGTVGINTKKVDGPFRTGNFSNIDDPSIAEKERGGTTVAHEIGHQLMLRQLNPRDSEDIPEIEKRLMWENGTTRKLPSQGGGVLSPEECAAAMDKACKAATEGFDIPAMLDWLISAQFERDERQRELKKKLQDFQKQLKGKK